QTCFGPPQVGLRLVLVPLLPIGLWIRLRQFAPSSLALSIRREVVPVSRHCRGPQERFQRNRSRAHATPRSRMAATRRAGRWFSKSISQRQVSILEFEPSPLAEAPLPQE